MKEKNITAPSTAAILLCVEFLEGTFISSVHPDRISSQNKRAATSFVTALDFQPASATLSMPLNILPRSSLSLRPVPSSDLSRHLRPSSFPSAPRTQRRTTCLPDSPPCA